MCVLLIIYSHFYKLTDMYFYKIYAKHCQYCMFTLFIDNKTFYFYHIYHNTNLFLKKNNVDV